MTVSVKVIRGRHYYDRLYKEGKIYHVSDDLGHQLLTKKNLDGTPRFKRMVRRDVSEEVEDIKPVKRGRGRPPKAKKKSQVDEKKVVDEKPVKDSLADVILEGDLLEEDSIEADFQEEVVKVTEDVEFFDNDQEQEYSHEI